ncbi:MAG: M20/M25/M40 family metallo-hydrolase [Lentisphaerae bacterium]|nr:M20/M25/M40 family metallo-hydrolase [Lentisphaerota bacterium]
MDKASLTRQFEDSWARTFEEWRTLLRFPSVSADPEHDRDCRACAEWLCEHLDAAGLEAHVLETPGKPAVFAQRPGRCREPTVLFYGHYDVQPPDPLDRWTTPPFEPDLRGGRVYARGAQDNKGQLFAALKAVETLARADALDIPVKILLEGEEECGSAGLTAVLPAWRERLAADVLLVTDTGTAPSGAPAVIMGLRGLVHATVVLHGPSRDLHSGQHGGVAPNPAAGLARLLATLHGPDGRVAVAGFYEGLAAPTERERALANAVPFDAAAYRAATGVPPAGGEQDYSPPERLGFRPALDVNGLSAGYAGTGVKTIIPARAAAKLTARLGAGQDPRACLDALIRHLEAHVPAGLRLEIAERGVGGAAFRLDPDAPLAARAVRVLRGLSGREPALLWEGASIPAVSGLAAAAGAEPLLAGFGAEADNAHAPDESYSIEQFRLGYLFVALMLRELAP